MDKIALITGATAGIGYSTALKLAEYGFNLLVTGRREERLKNLKTEIENYYGVKTHSLCFDVQDKNEVYNSIENLPDEWKNIDVLINNAGLAAGLNTVQEGDTEDWERMIDTNIKGLLYITRKVAPYMIEKEKGHIINVGSIAGKEVYKYGNVYCATKHAVDALTKGMRIDMLEKNIKVTQISPGMVETEFSLVRFKGDKEKAEKAYQGFTPLSGEDIAEIILFTITRPPHVNINDIVITATEQANSFYKNVK
ncbi:MAG: SDR family NAD(P)-dependent oxidoreductase [Bacteroidales bacterium]